MENVSEITINYKPKIEMSKAKQITESKDAELSFRSMWSDNIEHIEEVNMLMVSRSNKLLGFSKISRGGTCGSIIDIKIVFQTALKANAHGIILSHNHPSGNLKPSQADISLTKKIKDAGSLMEITLLDHLILTKDAYFSFADDGMM